jgi:phage terminase large subunit GpA-like protein
MILNLQGKCPHCKKEITMPLHVVSTLYGYDELKFVPFDCEHCGNTLTAPEEVKLVGDLVVDNRPEWEKH